MSYSLTQLAGVAEPGLIDSAVLAGARVLPLAASLGPEVAGAAAASVPVFAAGAAGLAGLYGVGRYIKGKLGDSKSETRMFGHGYGNARKRPRSDVVRDPASYRQLSSTKRRYGRRVRHITRSMRLLKTVTAPVRLRYGSVSDINATQGKFWLSNKELVAGQRVLPLYVVSLSNVRQALAADNQITAGRVMYELGATVSGYFWRAVAGVDPTNTAASAYSWRQVAPTDAVAAGDAIGRKGLQDWTRLRLCFWGKTKNPANIRVSLVRFLDEEICPETYDTKGAVVIGNLISPKAAEYWSNNHLKYLLNGHMGGNARFDRKKYVKVLKQWVINVNPIDAAAETAASDPRPHMKHLDIFNRWNRINDFTDRNLQVPQTYTDLTDVNRASDANNAFTGYLKDPTKGIYVIIESVQPAVDTVIVDTNPRSAPADGTDLTVSFDALIESNYTKMKDYN